MTENKLKEWAQLVCSSDLHAPLIPIQDDSFSIGRAKGCDLSLGENKFLSGKHCRLTRQSDGKIWLEDMSTNGTWINETKLTKGQKVQIIHGDEIFLVKRPGTQNVAYMFQETAELEKETTDETLVYDDEDDSEFTEEYKYDSKSDEPSDTAAVLGGVKRHRQEDSTEEQQDAKRLHGDAESKDENPEEKGPKKEESKSSKDDSHPVPLSSRKSQVPGTSRDDSLFKEGPSTAGQEGPIPDDQTPEEGPPQDDIAETLTCSICQDIFHDCISLQPCMHSFCAGCYSGWMEMAKTCPSCRITVQRINKNHIVNNLVEAYLKEHPDKKRSEEELKEMDEKNKITKEMLIPKSRVRDDDSYNSDDDDSDDAHSDSDEDNDGGAWMRLNFGGGHPAPIFPPRPPRSICRQCPGYIPPLATDPNVGTVVTLSPANQAGDSSSEASSVLPKGTNTTDKPSTSTAKSDPSIASTSSSSATAKTDKPKDVADKTSVYADPQSSCGSTSDATCTPNTTSCSSTTGTTTNAPSSSTSRDSDTHQVRITPSGDVVAMPTAPVFQCNINGNHLLCMCCQKPMPDRRPGFGQVQGAIPSQKCTICGRFYCHMYWGCQKIDCLGCLNKLKDMNFGDKCMRNFVNNNGFESEMLKKYLQAQGKNWKDVLSDSLVKLDAGQYNCPDRQRYQVNSETPVCYTCGMKNFQDLAYQYRKDIPRDQLSAEVTSRSDCYWGKNCRTQFSKPLHAQRFNHICDQTRF